MCSSSQVSYFSPLNISLQTDSVIFFDNFSFTNSLYGTNPSNASTVALIYFYSGNTQVLFSWMNMKINVKSTSLFL